MPANQLMPTAQMEPMYTETSRCFGAHTRTIQARHVVRGLLSETVTTWE